MKKLLACLALAAVIAAPAGAKPPPQDSLKVRTWDIDMTSKDDINRLAKRFLVRMYAICGNPNDAALSYVNTGGGLEQRAACKASLSVSPAEPEGVRTAFAIALERFR